VYAQLLALEAAGGGDTPESVNSALDDAINRINWSHSQSDFKAIFLIGDAPGHLDYPEETPFQVSLKQAKEKGIIVNTIQAGADPITHHQWQTIAALGGGAKFQVNQQGDSVAITTPFDETIAKASRELDATHLYFGDSTTQKQAQILLQQREKVYRESSSAALARRAKYKATTGHKNKLDETHDLVTEISGKRISLSAIPAESLPPEIQTMTANEQQAFIQQKASLRAQIELRLSQLTQQRDSYIAAQLKGQVDLDKSLDHQLLSTLQTQAQTKGFDYRHTNLDY